MVQEMKDILKMSSICVPAAEGRSALTPEEKIQLTMFEMKDDELRATLNKLDIDSLTPLEALKLLAKLKATLLKSESGAPVITKAPL